MDEYSRQMIMQIVGEKSTRSLKSILGALKAVNVDKIQNAMVIEGNDEEKIEILTEDGVMYHIYLSKIGSIEAVENVTTGEWPIRSFR